MNLERLNAIAHGEHSVAAPISDANLSRLLERAVAPGSGARVLDLGCGRGAWVVALLQADPVRRADAIDRSGEALAAARVAAEEAGVSEQVQWHQADVTTWESREQYDIVCCIGATHAFGGFAETLQAVRTHLRPGGRAIIGDGFWERPPSASALQALDASEDDLCDIATLLARVDDAGFVPAYTHASSSEEWDDYEWSWIGTLGAWAVDHPDDPDAGDAAELARTHREQWLNGYRGVLGFVCLVLTDAPAPSDGSA